MKRFMNKKLLVVGVAVAVLLGVGGVAFAYFTSTGTGTGSVAIGDASPLTVSVGAPLGGPLFPTAIGDPECRGRHVPYTVTNPGGGNVNFNTVTIDVPPNGLHRSCWGSSLYGQ